MCVCLAGDPSQPVEFVRGVAGAVTITDTATEGRSSIRAISGQTSRSPLVVRMADTASGTYRVEFIGMVEGEFDIRDFLERADGTPLNIEPVRVRIVTQLESNSGTDLFLSTRQSQFQGVNYFGWLAIAGAIWVAIPIVYGAVRCASRRRVPLATAAEPPPSIADLLRPLVEAASSGALSISERGRLELLLYQFWRERLALSGSQSAVIALLRRHEEAGELLRAVEKWLHDKSERTIKERGASEVARLLEPYRLRHETSVHKADAAEGAA